MSPKLAKRRDELALKFVDGYTTMNNRKVARPDVHAFDFRAGFDAAVAEMLPMLEQAMAALDEIAFIQHNYPDSLEAYQLMAESARKALAAYQAWRGEGEQ